MNQVNRAELEEGLEHKPKRFRDAEVVYKAVARLGPTQSSELAALLEMEPQDVERHATGHGKLVDVSGEDGEAVWELATAVGQAPEPTPEPEDVEHVAWDQLPSAQQRTLIAVRDTATHVGEVIEYGQVQAAYKTRNDSENASLDSPMKQLVAYDLVEMHEKGRYSLTEEGQLCLQEAPLDEVRPQSIVDEVLDQADEGDADEHLNSTSDDEDDEPEPQEEPDPVPDWNRLGDLQRVCIASLHHHGDEVRTRTVVDDAAHVLNRDDIKQLRKTVSSTLTTSLKTRGFTVDPGWGSWMLSAEAQADLKKDEDEVQPWLDRIRDRHNGANETPEPASEEADESPDPDPVSETHTGTVLDPDDLLEGLFVVDVDDVEALEAGLRKLIEGGQLMGISNHNGERRAVLRAWARLDEALQGVQG